MESAAVNLEGSQYLEGWNPGTSRLFLPTFSDARLGAEVVVRVGILGQSIRATLVGKVASVRRVGRPSLPPGVELTLDAGSLSAAGFLAAAARGEAITFRERSPRYVAERQFLIVRDGPRSKTPVKTINVSEGGCAVEWPGALPQVGEVLHLRLEGAIFTTSVRAVVCWSAAGSPGQGSSAGLRVVARRCAARAWQKFLAEVKKSGVRTA